MSVFSVLSKLSDVKIPVTVHFGNGQNDEVVYGLWPNGTYEVLPEEPQFYNHKFIGWYTDETGGEQINPGDKVDQSVTDVYAHYVEGVSVYFNAGEGSGGGTLTAFPGFQLSTGGQIPTATGMGDTPDLIGWVVAGEMISGSTIYDGSWDTATALYDKYATSFRVYTYNSSYQRAGIYSATRIDGGKPVYVDWGDGTIQSVGGDIDKIVHAYQNATTYYVVRISDNISTLALASSDTTWSGNTSANSNNVREILSMSSRITSIPAYAFYRLTYLKITSAAFGEGLTSLPTYAYGYCNYSTSEYVDKLEVPGRIKTIGTYAFYYCQYMKVPQLNEGTETIGAYAFYRCSYYTTSPASVTIPASVKTLGNRAFYYCRYLKSVTFAGEKVTSIPEYCFAYCFYYPGSTGTIAVPEGVTSIGTYAFAYCQYLTAITIPSSVTSIGSYSFYYSQRLATININRSTAPSVASSTFGNSNTYYTGRNSYSTGTNRLYVPAGATGYDAGYWLDPLCSGTKCGFTKVEI